MEKQGSIRKIKISRFVALIVIAVPLMATFFYFFGSLYQKFFMPLISFTIEQTHSEYEITKFAVETINKSKRISYEVNIHRPFVDEKGVACAYRIVTGNIHASALYIHPIIIYTLLLAWPALPVRNKLKAAAISLPLLIFIELIDIPIHLINQMETFSPVETMWNRLRIFYANFLGIGGRQFLALLVFGVSIAPFHLNFPVLSSPNIGRNDPCPCGSGKKYKRCCQR